MPIGLCYFSCESTERGTIGRLPDQFSNTRVRGDSGGRAGFVYSSIRAFHRSSRFKSSQSSSACVSFKLRASILALHSSGWNTPINEKRFRG